MWAFPVLLLKYHLHADNSQVFVFGLGLSTTLQGHISNCLPVIFAWSLTRISILRRLKSPKLLNHSTQTSLPTHLLNSAKYHHSSSLSSQNLEWDHSWPLPLSPYPRLRLFLNPVNLIPQMCSKSAHHFPSLLTWPCSKPPPSLALSNRSRNHFSSKPLWPPGPSSSLKITSYYLTTSYPNPFAESEWKGLSSSSISSRACVLPPPPPGAWTNPTPPLTRLPPPLLPAPG